MQRREIEDGRGACKGAEGRQNARNDIKVLPVDIRLTNISGTDATNIATASSSLASASDGIKTIAGAILTGKDAPAAARQQVGDGLQNALSALQNVTGEYFRSFTRLTPGTLALPNRTSTMRCLLERMLLKTAIEHEAGPRSIFFRITIEVLI